eukprot:7901048-Prorocentrum_lima.AAC.1
MQDRCGIDVPVVTDLFRQCPYILPKPAKLIPRPPLPPPPTEEQGSGPSGTATGPGPADLAPQVTEEQLDAMM